MKLLLALSALAYAALPGEPRGVQFFSICGSFDSSAKTLNISEHQRVHLQGKLPESAGKYCVRGEELRPPGDQSLAWTFESRSYETFTQELKFPVMICAKMFSKKFYTYWNNAILRFEGPFPKSKVSEFGWCADGTDLPVQEKNDWHFDSEQFRAMPDPDKRSGMSIGNQ